ncbi:uncharacterized protein LOC132726137 [Ruditapes philippinarum]|uniref:uncharacterized protein LOC132726137 n=1 Tax=Ruditapes philippinarum TaxID=129788 RepID=UPI00295C1A64|nr:uncharacterized protein LOC132726137 [Ruditapes philippinarum]
MLENAGFDQNGDAYTEMDATFLVGVPSTYQLSPPQQGPEDLICQPSIELTNTTVMSEPQPGTVLNNVQKPLRNHTVTALLVLCCFLPTGLFAVYFAYKARNLELSGDYDNAKLMSDCTRKLIIATTTIGIFLAILTAVNYNTQIVNYYKKIKQLYTYRYIGYKCQRPLHTRKTDVILN